MIRFTLLLAAVLALPSGKGVPSRVEKADMAHLQKEIRRTYLSYVAYLRRGDRCYSGFGLEVGKDFYVVTTSRILNSTGKIQVQFFMDEKRKYDAKIIRADQTYDIAVLEITERSFWVKRRRLPQLGKTNFIAKGDCVFCCSCPDPFDLWRMTFSAVLNPDYVDSSKNGISYIEHTAKLEEGEYGGPLFRIEVAGGKFVARHDGTIVLDRTKDGAPFVKKVQLIGMNSQWVEKKDGSERSFALPMENVVHCVRRLLRDARAESHG